MVATTEGYPIDEGGLIGRSKRLSNVVSERCLLVQLGPALHGSFAEWPIVRTIVGVQQLDA